MNILNVRSLIALDAMTYQKTVGKLMMSNVKAIARSLKRLK